MKLVKALIAIAAIGVGSQAFGASETPPTLPGDADLWWLWTKVLAFIGILALVGGMLIPKIYRKFYPQTAAEKVALQNHEVKRRSAWAGFQYFIGPMCITIGIIYGSKVEGWVGLCVIAFGIQACFVGFLINVITDIRWFLQQSLTVQREIRDKEEVSGSDESN